MFVNSSWSFARDDKADGYWKDGPVPVDVFVRGERDEAGLRKSRLLRQLEVNSVMKQLVNWIASEAARRRRRFLSGSKDIWAPQVLTWAARDETPWRCGSIVRSRGCPTDT